MARRIAFKRVTAAFDEMARARLCQSSGSEYSADNSAELSDLINSFIERDDRSELQDYVGEDEEFWEKEGEDNVSESEVSLLRNLLRYGDDSDEHVKDMIRSETELVCKLIGNGNVIGAGISSHSGEEGFKRQIMNGLRERGLDAGLCKSQWKKAGQYPGGDYEYIDVMVNGNRYIVEVNLGKEFTIARPTNGYLSLLESFPAVFVGKPDDLKRVVKLMGNAVRRSMRNRDMHVAPWRKNGYMLAKWFSSYKRTTNAYGLRSPNLQDSSVEGFRSVGFEMSPAALNHCRGEMVRKVGLRVGRLAEVLEG